MYRKCLKYVLLYEERKDKDLQKRWAKITLGDEAKGHSCH